MDGRCGVCLYVQMDLPGAMEPPEVMGVLGLDKITDKPWHIQCVP
jgi:hypothetical protein